MLKGSVGFFVLAIIAGLFALGEIAEAATNIARILFFVFIILAVLNIVRHKKRGF